MQIRLLDDNECHRILSGLASGKALSNPKFPVTVVDPQSFKLQLPRSSLVITDSTANPYPDRGGGELAILPMLRLQVLNDKDQPVALRDIGPDEETTLGLSGVSSKILSWAKARMEKDKALAADTIADIMMNL